MKKFFFLHLGGEPGPVKVQFFDTNWVYFGEDTYTYYEPEQPEKRKKQCLPCKKRKRQEMKEIKDVIRETVEATLKQLKRESNKEPNETMGSQKGESNLWYCLFVCSFFTC